MISIWRWLGLALPVLVFGLLWSQNLYAMAPDRGVFLVASDQLADPRFHAGVILLIQHDAEGSAGLVINRQSGLALTEILPENSKLAVPGAVLSYGGPVEPETLLALVKVRQDSPEPADKIFENLYITGVGVLEEWPMFAGQVLACRAFAGYCGWAPGQLEKEIQRGDWQVVPADAASVFNSNGKALWENLRKTRTESSK